MKSPLLALLLAPALAAPAAPLAPEIEVTVRDAGTLKRVVDRNAWMADFSGTNLYRGTMVRLGPVFFALGRKGEDAWEGRLVDWIVARLLEGRPARLSYFGAPGLASPFGVTLPALTAPQRESVRLLLESLRSGPDVPVEAILAGVAKKTVTVTPVRVKAQKLAAVAAESCLVVSRDPSVAAALSLRCARPGETNAATAPSAARLDVDLSQLVPAASIVREKLLGVGPRLSVGFDFEPREARFVPSAAEVPVAGGHLLREAPLDDALVGALPAGTVFLASVTVPDPGPLDAEALGTWIRTVREKPPAGTRTVAVASLGTRRVGGEDEPLTALLLRDRGETEAGVRSLFSRGGTWNVEVSRACKGLLVASPSPTAVREIEAACSGKAPSLRQLPAPLLSRLTTGSASGSVYLNGGRLLASALELGWARQTRGEAAPPEVASALGLLDRLPAWALAGRAEGSMLKMRAATWSPAAPAPKKGGRTP